MDGKMDVCFKLSVFTCRQCLSCPWQTCNAASLCADCNSKVVHLERLQSLHNINRLFCWSHPVHDLKKEIRYYNVML